MTEENNVEPTDEQIAMSLGWHPLEEFRGDPEDFVDAEAYVKRGMENLPVLQSNVKTQATKIERLEKIVEDQKAFNERNLVSQRESMQAEYDKELARIVEDGDSEAFAKLKKPEPVARTISSAEEAFISENDWYGTDSVMTAAAQAISTELAGQFPGFTPEQNLNKTIIRMKDEFPHKFTNGKDDADDDDEERIVTRVEGGRRIPKKKSGNTYDDLPAEDKMVCNNFIKEGIIKDRDAYVASYQWEK